MKKAFFIAAALSVAFAAPAFAADRRLECPAIKAGEEPAAVKDLRLSFGQQDPLNVPDALNAAVDRLRKDGANRTLVIDNLISAYCPVVAANSALTDQQKVARVQRFATIVVPLVYGLESAEEIILNVPLPPAVIDAVNEKARAVKISPEEWAAGAVERALGGK